MHPDKLHCNRKMRYLYTAAFYLILPFILIRVLWRNRQNPDIQKRIWERLGFFTIQQDATPSIWVHAVSYGEAVAAEPLLKQLRTHFPTHKIYITTMTGTGASRVQSTWKSDHYIKHLFVPYDIPFAIKRFIKKTKPMIGIIMETEIWPNILHITGKLNLPVLLANARLSALSMKRYQRVNRFMMPAFNNISKVAAQSRLDAQHFSTLGFAKNRISVAGNLKFDIDIPHEQINSGKELRASFSHSQVLIAASTHANEEEQIIELFTRLRVDHPNLLLILVPRHPYRFDEVASLCQRKGYEIARRSLQEHPTLTTQIYIGDTMGELYFYYALADIAFVGGSLVSVGGHNLLEPAAVKLPIVTGPHLYNFTAISGLLVEQGSLFVAANLEELYQTIQHLLADEDLRRLSGEKGFQVLAQNQGAATNHLQVVRELLSPPITNA